MSVTQFGIETQKSTAVLRGDTEEVPFLNSASSRDASIGS